MRLDVKTSLSLVQIWHETPRRSDADEAEQCARRLTVFTLEWDMERGRCRWTDLLDVADAGVAL